MTREQIITRVKHSSMYIDDRETADYIINALEQQPCDCISLEVYKQVIWERDIAIEQLKELGYEFGEKIRTSDDCVNRQATLDAIIKELCIKDESYLLPSEKAIYNVVKNMPPVTPTHGTCKDCRWLTTDEDGNYYCRQTWDFDSLDFYCADYEIIEDMSKYEYICPNCDAEVVSKLNTFECWRCGAKMRGDKNDSN